MHGRDIHFSEEWVNFLRENSVKISMTGKGRCLDNIYIERFWRSVKREEFYLHEYANVRELTTAIGMYIEFYNNRRWHHALNYKTPAEIYFVVKKRKSLWICERVLRTSQRPSGRMDKLWITLNTLPTTCPRSLTPRPHNHRLNSKFL